MAQVIGRKVVIGAYNEATYGISAGLTTGQKLHVKTNALSGIIAQLIDETLSGNRMLPQSIEGNKDVSGSVAVNVGPQSIGFWLKHTLGLVATDYAVANRTTATITGVEVLRAETATTAGAGTLAFTASGTTITWAPSGDTAGTPVNIGAGGDFTVTSTGGLDLFIRVTAALLPGGDESDTVTVIANTSHDHVFSPAGAEAVGFTLETDLGAEMTTAYRYLQFNGCRIGKASFKFPNSGFIEGNFDIRGANFSNSAGAPLDASLDDYGHTAFSMFRVGIEIDGATYAEAQEVTLEFDNDSDDSEFVIGGGGVRGAMTHGFLKVSGQLSALFRDSVTLNKALAGTVAALRIHAYNGTGLGTVGNESITFRIPDLKFEAKTPTVEGPKGLRLMLKFNGHRATSAEGRAEVSLRSTRAANTF